ncbi:MAG: glycoside hydrolase family 57 protein [Leptospiraceae bacterium]|nr:glycoside hydrolase family 57 protein [Leptospiraceae bacterium]
MTSIVFYFEIHQPFRLKPYSFFKIGSDPFYQDDLKNSEVLYKVAHKCYMPATQMLLDMIHRYDGRFRVTFSISGTALEQFESWTPEVLDQFRKLSETGCVEFLTETYYHSLAGLIDDEEFRIQVKMHQDIMERLLGVKPTAFRNTELIYNNHIAWLAKEMGFKSILLEGAKSVLDWRSPNFLYRARYEPDLICHLKNYTLSDDVAFRFSQRSWSEFPLSAEKYSHWVHRYAGGAEVINLFMDFETFGEHQWEDTGIFDFMRALPEMIFRHPDFHFHTVSESARLYSTVGDIDTDWPVSWADEERDVSAWLGNAIQNTAFNAVYELGHTIKEKGRDDLLHIFRKLQTSDHFYYMCTKFFNDGDVHKYFSPYESPYDAYIYYMNILQDLRQRIG